MYLLVTILVRKVTNVNCCTKRWLAKIVKSCGARSTTTVLSKLKFGAKLSYCLVEVGLA